MLQDLCTFLMPCHGVCSVRANGNLLWKSCAWRKLILAAAGEDPSTHKVKGSRLGCFFNTRRRKKEKEDYLLRVPDERNRWLEEETNKDEGRNSRLRPQAGQIQDSVAAGSSLRQDNRAEGCVEKIRSVKSTVHPGMYAAGPVESPVLFVPFFIFATPVLGQARGLPALTIRWFLCTPCLQKHRGTFYCLNISFLTLYTGGTQAISPQCKQIYHNQRKYEEI